MQWVADWYLCFSSMLDMIPHTIGVFGAEGQATIRVPLWQRALGLWQLSLPRRYDVCHVSYRYNNRTYTYVLHRALVGWPPHSSKDLLRPLGFHDRSVIVQAIAISKEGPKDVSGQLYEFLGPLHDFHGCAWKMKHVFPGAAALVVCTLGSRHAFGPEEYVVF
jgi:hypothetical protein